ncbi:MULTISPECIES: ATP-grasp domain-containing protein [Streptomyces]|uniref:ATP-grasp domain-containing protein n=1 Tax=Streptomyces sudanensis TaxID=436397 RepID=A0ABY4TIB0_9ACTN|nr:MULTISPECIES: ATP-grasp domain-containing protein [Streptomyces]URN18236.1 ATP-grasp domain-containing protein [Streptomyces sudanensis]
MPRVAVIGGELYAVRHAKDLGIDVVQVHVPGKYDERVAHYCEQVLEVGALADSEAVVEALRPLHRARPFDRVVTTSEFGGVTAARVAEEFSLPGNSVRTAEILKDKALMRRVLDEHGLSPVAHRLVRSAEDIVGFLPSVDGRMVVKPVDGTASAHVQLVRGEEEAAAAWKAMRDAGYTEALAEEFLEGPVGSVESFSAGGRHLPVTVTEYVVNDRFVEIGTTMPSRITDGVTRQLFDLTTALLDAVGLVEGPAHTEFVLTPRGPRILESHNRMAGGGMPELVRRAHGLDFARMFLSVPTGLEALPTAVPEHRGAAIRMFAPDPGVVTHVTGLDEVDATVVRTPPGVVVPGTPGIVELADAEVGVMLQLNPGDVVPPLDAGWNRRAGYVIASGRDCHEATARCEDVFGKIGIHTS